MGAQRRVWMGISWQCLGAHAVGANTLICGANTLILTVSWQYLGVSWQYPPCRTATAAGLVVHRLAILCVGDKWAGDVSNGQVYDAAYMLCSIKRHYNIMDCRAQVPFEAALTRDRDASSHMLQATRHAHLHHAQPQGCYMYRNLMSSSRHHSAPHTHLAVTYTIICTSPHLKLS